MHLAVSLVLLGAVLAAAIVRPRGLPEVAVAVPAAGLLIAVHAVSWSAATAELRRIGPVVGFLAAVLALAEACAAEGVFDAAGARLATLAGASGLRLLSGTFVLAAATTAVLSLDTTVLLLTPVILQTARRADLPAGPPLYATAHLANSSSLLLPVSNLTNLLALAVLPISFLRFAALMALPWLAAITVEYAVFRRRYATVLLTRTRRAPSNSIAMPHFATWVLGLTLLGFVATSLVGVAPVWAAAAGAAVLQGRRLVRGQTHVPHVLRAAAPAFCLFVLALAVVVRAVSDSGLDDLVRAALPSGSSLAALLAVAAVSAVLANVVNNLPAALLLLPVAAVGGVTPVLAMLIGVNVGPNLTYPGSLATLLWRRALHDVEEVPVLREWSVLGAATVPAVLSAATLALWLSTLVVGSG